METPGFLGWILWMATAPCYGQTVVVGIYDYSDLSAKETMRVTEISDLVFTHSGIHIVWRYCRGALAVMPETHCGGQMEPKEIAMRIQPQTSRSPHDGTMGHSIVTAKGGSYASVLAPAVRAQAAGFGMPFDVLMGYAVAHEVGHCLLGPGHSHGGLMRGAWNRNDASEMSRRGLHLTKQEARRAVAGLKLAEPEAPE
jgi:hypothetical protein